MSNDTIINGYLVIWSIISLCIWIVPPFLALDAFGEFKSRTHLSLYRRLFWLFAILTIIDILTAPLQIAAIQGLWR